MLHRIFDERISKDSAYPSDVPSVGDSPEYYDVTGRFVHPKREDSPMRWEQAGIDKEPDQYHNLRTTFAPPGYC